MNAPPTRSRPSKGRLSKLVRRSSFLVNNDSRDAQAARKGLSDKIIPITLPSSLASRARSDSALPSLRRALEMAGQDAMSPVSKLDTVHAQTGLSPPLITHRQRLSLALGSIGPQFDLDHKRTEGFYDVFGYLGVPMVISFLCSAVAVLSQAYIQVYPVDFANYLMDTATYDNGEFWMLPDADVAPTIVATGLLLFCASSYVYLAAFMVFFRHRAIVKKATPLYSVPESSLSSAPGGKTKIRMRNKFPELNFGQLFRLVLPLLLHPNESNTTTFSISTNNDNNERKNSSTCVQPVEFAGPAKSKQKRNSLETTIPLREIYQQFLRPDGVYHAYYNVLYDTPKLVFQSITLLAYLRKGFPIALTACYAVMLTVNYLISFFRFQRKRIDRALIVTRLFYLFDLFFAAFAPIVVLGFAYYSFHFDREVYDAKYETLPPGLFDRNARLFADPHEMSIFRLAFGSLRLVTASTIVIKCSLLLLSLYKWRKIIIYLIQVNHLKLRQLNNHFPMLRKHSGSRRHLIFGMVVFIFFGAGIALYTTGSIWTSTHHCENHPHCVVISYHWTFPGESCPCLVYINRKADPRRFDEWQNPPDVSEELSILAKMGELRVIQIVNRALPTLPDALRRCNKLEQLILMYTKTEIIPEWFSELSYLQYLHIEGDLIGNLKNMPLDMFAHMSQLTYLHTGLILRIKQYPSLDTLSKLKTLVIAAPHAMREFPSFTKLVNLRSLLLVEPARIRRLPSLRPLKKLTNIELFYRSEMCCNGFLTPGNCDLSDYQCMPRTGEADVQCQNDSMPGEEWELVKRIDGHLCTNWTHDLIDMAPSRASTDEACGGVLFRKCMLGNTTGMCYNGRMQVVYCDTAGYYEKMRRLQIERDVGLPCDTSEEAWLGCSHTR